MNAASQTAAEQLKLWNGRAGHAWVDAQQLLDGILQPFESILLKEVAATSARDVLDVGCGTGSTILAVARQLGGKGRAVGVDISEPMLALARARAEREHIPATFICADAQTYAFEAASFDTIISRFGVMFFEDSVRAFANLRRAARDGAALRFIAWRGPRENPFMTTAERAAAPLLPDLPPRQPEGPGQFAFADEERVRGILKAGGWSRIDMRAMDVECSFPAQELSRYVMRLGPVGMLLAEADEPLRARVGEAVRAAFEPYVHGAEVRFTGACWLACAQA